MQLERLARTYWRFLSRCTLGLIRVDYSANQRTVVLLRRPLRLLRFKAPEYAMDEQRGTVRWRIEDGLLVDRRGRHELRPYRTASDLRAAVTVPWLGGTLVKLVDTRHLRLRALR